MTTTDPRNAPSSAPRKNFRKASDAWPASRLLEIWNGLSGVQPVVKLRDRATAVSRIWKHIQTLKDPGAPEAPVSEPGPLTRKEQVLALLRSASGATLAQIMAATGWQKHSVRGFLSGAIHKKMGLPVVSFVNTDGERVYRLKR